MSRFYGVLESERDRHSTRCGNRRLTATAAGERGAIETHIESAPDGTDRYTIRLIPWRRSGPDGQARLIGSGILDAEVAG